MTTTEKAPQLTPRGTDRVRRRAQQTAAKTVGEKELADLVVPTDAEKKAHADKVKKEEAGRFGAAATKRQRRKVVQAENVVRAEKEAALVSSSVPSLLAEFRPGQQVDYRTARLYQKAHQKAQRDEALAAGKAAGRAVRDVLRGRAVSPNQQSRFRKLARHAAAQAAAAKAQ